jgi:hypothetical protein
MTIGPMPTPSPQRLNTPTVPGTEDEQLLQSVPSPLERAQAVQVHRPGWYRLRTGRGTR